MIDDLNEVIRQLLIQELPVKNGEVEISFDQPKREWSSRLSRPTLNLFLYDMQENTQLRNKPGWSVSVGGQGNGSATLTRQPMRMDLQYMITAWATESEDEYRLLGRCLMALSRYPNVPRELFPESLKDQPFEMPLEVAQPGALQNVTDIWSVLDNEIKPAIGCKITLAVMPYAPVEEPVVKTREIKFEQTNELASETSPSRNYWSIGGKINTTVPFENISLTLVERALTVHLRGDEGRFTVGHLEAGDYTLEVSVKGRKKPKRFKLTVPSPDYDIKV